MSLPPFSCRILAAAVALYLIGLLCLGAGEAPSKDAVAPKIPGCSNEYEMVKVEWLIRVFPGRTIDSCLALRIFINIEKILARSRLSIGLTEKMVKILVA